MEGSKICVLTAYTPYTVHVSSRRSEIVTGGNGINGSEAICVTEAHCGPVVTNPATPTTQPISVGAKTFTSLGETLHAISSHRLIHYPAAETSSDRTAGTLRRLCAMDTMKPARNRKLEAKVHNVFIPFFPKNAPSRGDT